MFCCVFAAVVTSGGSCYMFFTIQYFLYPLSAGIKCKPVYIFVFSTHFYLKPLIECIPCLHFTFFFIVFIWTLELTEKYYCTHSSLWEQKKGNSIIYWNWYFLVIILHIIQNVSHKRLFSHYLLLKMFPFHCSSQIISAVDREEDFQ